jgi:hypothetical protein
MEAAQVTATHSIIPGRRAGQGKEVEHEEKTRRPVRWDMEYA